MMQVHGLIYVCPECGKVVIYTPMEDGVFNFHNLLCSDDGYLMKHFKVDTIFIDSLLKEGKSNANT